MQEYSDWGNGGHFSLGEGKFGAGEFYVDEGGGMDWSFEEQAEVDERQRVENMMLETEFKLFEEQHSYDEILQENKRKELLQRGNERARYYSEGYHAHVDEVDELELARWQCHFPYLHVVGMGYEIDRVDGTDLVVTGTKAPISRLADSIPDASSYADEEIIAIHYDGMENSASVEEDEEETRKRSHDEI